MWGIGRELSKNSFGGIGGGGSSSNSSSKDSFGGIGGGESSASSALLEINVIFTVIVVWGVPWRVKKMKAYKISGIAKPWYNI